LRRASSWREGLQQLGWYTLGIGRGNRWDQAMRDFPELRGHLERAAMSGRSGSALREVLLDGAPPSVWRLTGELTDSQLEGLLLDAGGNEPDTVRQALVEVAGPMSGPVAVFVQLGPGRHEAVHTSPTGIDSSGINSAGSNPSRPNSMGDSLVDSLVGPLGSPSPWVPGRIETPSQEMTALRAREFAVESKLRVSRVVVPSVQLAKQSKVSTAEAVNRAITRLRADDALGSRVIEIDSLYGSAVALAQAGGYGRSWRMTDRALMPILRIPDYDLAGLREELEVQLSAGARMLLVGGQTLAWNTAVPHTSELGAQSPSVTMFEPAYAQSASWLVRGAFERMGDRLLADRVGNTDQGAYYLKVSSTAVDQLPFESAMERIGVTILRRQVLCGAYRLRQSIHFGRQRIQIVATGADVPLALAVAEQLEVDDLAVNVVDITSLDRLRAGWQRGNGFSSNLERSFVPGAPVITIDPARDDDFAWLGPALTSRMVPLEKLDPGLANECNWTRRQEQRGTTTRGMA
jgi:hypothetical protein